MLYRFIRFVISIGIKIYYKEIRVLNKHLLEKEHGPLILIANHPNTLMDAWMIGYVSSRKVHFMAKATFFNSAFKRKLLGVLGIIPVNRKSDKATAGVNNKDSFEACYRLLEKGGVLVVFPEGTSYLERKLREIKTGTARIALEVERRNQGQLGLKVIPIGLNYISANSYRGSVLIQLGNAIPVSAYYTDSSEKTSSAAMRLTEQFRVELSQVFVNLADSEVEVLIEKLQALFITKYSTDTSVHGELNFIKDVHTRLEEMALTSAWKLEEINQKTDSIITKLKLLGIKYDFLDRPYRRGLFFRQFVQSWFFVLISTPLFIVGFLHHVIPYALIGWLIPKLTKEPEYHAPLAVLLGLVLYPINYLILFLGVNMFVPLPWWADVFYVISMPVLGTFAHFYLRFMMHLRSKLQFAQFAKTRRVLLQEIKSERTALKNLIFKD
jgi:1-acyl-sn-glycerol-3-phosphate acyltransferase